MICAQTRTPGMSVSQVARRYDVNAKLDFGPFGIATMPLDKALDCSLTTQPSGSISEVNSSSQIGQSPAQMLKAKGSLPR
jgi:hypothetical protein